jgi:TPR repeat protein
LAADQGHANAQFNLAMMYQYGIGITQDYMRAYMWFDLASSEDESNGAKNRDIVASRMTPQQLQQTQVMSRDCQARKLKECD